MAMTKPKGYHSYLLRMWQTSDGARYTWRASLEQPDTKERRGFATLDQLFDFLKEQAALQPEQMGTGAREQVASSGGQEPHAIQPGKEKKGR
jgi:hypothetical protein